MQVVITAPPTMQPLSSVEIDNLKQAFESYRYPLFRNCALAVLNTGVISDDNDALLAQFSDFDIRLAPSDYCLDLELINPPTSAFVDGRIIATIQNNLYSVLRDILLIPEPSHNTYNKKQVVGKHQPAQDEIFQRLRSAKVLSKADSAELIVCWGGHAIQSNEFEYAKAVGKQLGLRAFNICTGCGTGAMYAPMQGAAIAHRLQHFSESRFIGVTESSILISEPPNPLVNELVIMPNIEQRLEAFVRLAHGIIIFPGGVGTAEEFLYIIGVLMHSENQAQILPLILTGPKSSASYFEILDNFIVQALGEACRQYYQIIIDNPVKVAQTLHQVRPNIAEYRQKAGDALNYNGSLLIPEEFKQAFTPSHENMTNLQLDRNQPVAGLAASLRRAFSGIVAGNIKKDTIQAIDKYGPFQLHGDPVIMASMDEMLQGFIAEGRFKLMDNHYVPCYRISTPEAKLRHAGSA